MPSRWRRTYTVMVCGPNHIRIERIDRQPIRCGWDVIQAIKDEVLGKETTAIEVYPASGSVVNEINSRHLFVVDDAPATLWGWGHLEVRER